MDAKLQHGVVGICWLLLMVSSGCAVGNTATPDVPAEVVDGPYSMTDVMAVYDVPARLTGDVQQVVNDLNLYRSSIEMWESESLDYRMALSIVHLACYDYVDDEIVVEFRPGLTGSTDHLAEEIVSMTRAVYSDHLLFRGCDSYLFRLPRSLDRSETVHLAMAIWERYGSDVQGVGGNYVSQPLAVGCASWVQ